MTPKFVLFVLTTTLAALGAAAEELPLPPLAMKDIQYRTEKIDNGVYAVIPDLAVRNTSGFIIGERGVLVVDGIFNVDKTNKVLKEVRKVTDKPVLYVVNTNYNCDHVCGNSAFSADTKIIAQRKTRAHMEAYAENRDLIKSFIPASESHSLSDEAAPARQADIIFDEHITVDLGGRIVEVWHFGPGNTPGDTVIYDPASRTAWTGNLLMAKGLLTIWSGHGSANEFAKTLSLMHQKLDIEHIVPGHSLGRVEGGELVTDQIFYASQIMQSVRGALNDGLTADQLVAKYPLETYPRPPGVNRWLNTLGRAHELNLRKTYQVMAGS